jgi:uncharacterized NAD(P)/FAD-binding protein YdhS
MLTSAPITTIAIVGAGFSGCLVATHLLKTANRPLLIELIDRSHEIGPGVAYSTDDTSHLLNVSAGKMSAFSDDPGHLLRWLHNNRSELAAFLPNDLDASSFIPRHIYGLYIQSILEEAEAAAPSNVRLERVIDEVVTVEPQASCAIVSLRSGRAFVADKIVLALGNAPAVPSASQTKDDDTPYLRNAWSASALAGLELDAPVLLIGTGLTMMDMVVSLHSRHHQGKIYAVSRRGLFPLTHRSTKPYPAFLTPDTAPKTIRAEGVHSE